MDWLIEPFRYLFMWTALLAAVLVGTTCAALGAHVVQRRMAFIGDALAHTTLPGLVIAHLYGWSLSVGGLAAALVTALFIGWISRRRVVREDTAIGVVFTGMFALGIVLMSRQRSFRDLSHMLFGNILGVSGSDLWLIAGVAVVVLVVLAVLHKEMELTSFDPIQAEVIGIRTERLRYVLLGLLALAVVAGIQAVGVVLTCALLVTPAATAALLTRRFDHLILISMSVAGLASVGGLLGSFYLSVSSGASIVLACVLAFMAAWIFRGVHSVLGKGTTARQVG